MDVSRLVVLSVDCKENLADHSTKFEYLLVNIFDLAENSLFGVFDFAENSVFNAANVLFDFLALKLNELFNLSLEEPILDQLLLSALFNGRLNLVSFGT